MPDTVSVSPAQPNKLVVNGCDLVNRAELSQSQNRELQRYIDSNSHLLGLIDKPKDENEEPVDHSKYSSLGSYSTASAPVESVRSVGTAGGGGGAGDGYASNRSSLSLNRVNSPASSEYSRRKGVSWVDNQSKDRAHSHSPSADQATQIAQNSAYSAPKQQNAYAMEAKNPYSGGERGNDWNSSGNWAGGLPDSRYSSMSSARPYSPSYSTSDRRRSYDYDYGTQNQKASPWGRQTESPWGTASVTSRESRSREQRGRGRTDWKGFPIPDIPLYSSLERHPDDYNRFRELHSRSQERDDSKKFYGYGDHKVSGIELQGHRWTGGEIVTDPTFIKKSLKPRRTYYSPIGDGVVEADGIEMKPPPKDMTPYLNVRHERYVEPGSGGRAGRRLIEETWSEGGGNRGDDGRGDGREGPRPANDDDGRDRNRGPPYDDTGAPKRRPPYDDGGGPKRRGDGDGPPAKSPFGDDGSLGRVPKAAAYPASNDGDGGVRPDSALSLGTDGMPRQGWTKTFIVNPRELIHQYGNETQTIIFDLEDHTPKTTTTIKERISQSPAPPKR